MKRKGKLEEASETNGGDERNIELCRLSVCLSRLSFICSSSIACDRARNKDIGIHLRLEEDTVEAHGWFDLLLRGPNRGKGITA